MATLTEQLESLVVLDIDDIQARSILGFNKAFGNVIAFDLAPNVDRATAARVLRGLICKVTTARDMLEFRQTFRHILRANRATKVAQERSALNGKCLAVELGFNLLSLLAPPADIQNLKEDYVEWLSFSAGMPASRASLGDANSELNEWPFGAEKNPDLLLIVEADQEATLDAYVDEILADVAPAFGTPIYNERGSQDKSDVQNHFFLLDGVSQPALRGYYKNAGGSAVQFTTREVANIDDSGKLVVNDDFGKPGFDLVWPGSFVIGYPDQSFADNALLDPSTAVDKFKSFINDPLPDGVSWTRNGSFDAFRRLRMFTGQFWTWMEANCPKAGWSADKLCSRVLGRWPDGTPVVRDADSEIPDLAADTLANNAFLFQDVKSFGLVKNDGKPDPYPKYQPDPLGAVCPFPSHIRKVNPRDTPNDFGDIKVRRILRRSMNYGPSPDPQHRTKIDDEDRGLLFFAYQSNILLQFQFLQQSWANSLTNPAQAKNSVGVDLFIGQQGSLATGDGRDRSFTFPVGNGSVTLSAPEFVKPRGGGYFFSPGISGLTELTKE